jgi:tRNA-guanine transglycosylase
MSFFEVTHTSSKSKARLGTIQTDHGAIHTPAFVPVGTKGTIKGLTQEQITDLHVQLSFVNTYHLVIHPGVEVLQRSGGVHPFAKYSIPLMSDSGGFQVFSLAQQNKKRVGILRGSDIGVGKLATPFDLKEQPLVEKISEDGVMFRSIYDGQLINFTPETSMDFQKIIGADINMAFDECTYYPATHEYTEKAMERTHRWLTRCIKHRSIDSIAALPPDDPSVRATCRTINQYLYGIIQGGTFEDLRKKSAEFVVAQNTPGIAIGGVSVGETKEEMRNQIKWVAPYLPKDRPVHLLGVGQVDDLIDLVKYGIDTFDCVEPTRVARMGSAYQTQNVLAHIDGVYSPYEIDINKAIYKADLSPVDAACNCTTCVNFSKAYLHHLFKQRELLGYTLLSYHNLFVMERLMDEVRKRIQGDLI